MIEYTNIREKDEWSQISSYLNRTIYKYDQALEYLGDNACKTWSLLRYDLKESFLPIRSIGTHQKFLCLLFICVP